MEDTLCDTAPHYFLCTPKLQSSHVILYSEPACSVFPIVRVPGTCKSISFLKIHFSKQLFKKAILDIAVAIIISLHKGSGNQLHLIVYQDQPTGTRRHNYFTTKKTPTISVVHEDLSLAMVLSAAITLRGPGTGKGCMHHDPSSSALPSRCTQSFGPWGGTVQCE